MMSDVTLIKMINGEEIIAKVSNEDEDTITVEKPAIVMLQPGQNNQVQVQMGPWDSFTDKPIAISKPSVMYIAEPTTELLNSYNQNFGSGLVMPSKKLDTSSFLKG